MWDGHSCPSCDAQHRYSRYHFRMRARAIVILGLILAAIRLYAESPIIDLGWLRASQTDQGWLIEKIAMFTESGQTIQPGDIVVSIDGHRVDDENALSASNELDWLRNADVARVIRHGAPSTLQLRLPDPLLKDLFAFRHRYVHQYPKDERITALHLPGIDGKPTTWKFAGAQTTLIHFWSPT